MTHMSVAEAETQLRKLVEQAANGEEIVLTEGDRPLAKLVAAGAIEEGQTTRPRAKFGSGRGQVLYMAPDFDAPLEDFKEYME